MFDDFCFEFVGNIFDNVLDNVFDNICDNVSDHAVDNVEGFEVLQIPFMLGGSQGLGALRYPRPLSFF
jgi:hypothetical protein